MCINKCGAYSKLTTNWKTDQIFITILHWIYITHIFLPDNMYNAMLPYTWFNHMWHFLLGRGYKSSLTFTAREARRRHRRGQQCKRYNIQHAILLDGTLHTQARCSFVESLPAEGRIICQKPIPDLFPEQRPLQTWLILVKDEMLCYLC